MGLSLRGTLRPQRRAPAFVVKGHEILGGGRRGASTPRASCPCTRRARGLGAAPARPSSTSWRRCAPAAGPAAGGLRVRERPARPGRRGHGHARAAHAPRGAPRRASASCSRSCSSCSSACCSTSGEQQAAARAGPAGRRASRRSVPRRPALRADRRTSWRRSPRSTPTCRATGRCAGCCRATSAPARRWSPSTPAARGRERPPGRAHGAHRDARRAAPRDDGAAARPARALRAAHRRLTAAERREALAASPSGEPRVVVGTHALLQGDVAFAEPRRCWSSTSSTASASCSATSWRGARPRRPHAARAVHDGHADPAHAGAHLLRRPRRHRHRRRPGRPHAGRHPAGGRGRRDAGYDFVRKQLDKGRQAYVVCPRSRSPSRFESPAAVAEAERLPAGPFRDYARGGAARPDEVGGPR